MASESKRTVLIAIGANLVIAVAKIAAGLLSGSPAILAEGAHSVADTGNEVFLLISLSKAERAPDEAHPFGYGKERFFWALVAAIGIFVLGAGFSFLQGIEGLLSGGHETPSGYVAAYVVLAISAVAEGVSWFRAYHQTRDEARTDGKDLRRFLRESTDPTTKTVLLEDSGALVGIALAFLGVGLSQLTGVHELDPIASLLIGGLLAVIAFRLAQGSKHLLLGTSATEEERDRIRSAIEAHGEVVRVVELLTMVVGPDAMLVAARVDLGAGLDADGVERLAEALDHEVRRIEPAVTHFFLDPTSPHEQDREIAAAGRSS